MDSTAELESVKNTCKDLEEQLKETKGRSRRNTAIMVFLIAVLIVVIVNLILRARPVDDDDEDFYDAPPKKAKRSRPEQAAGREPRRREHKRMRGGDSPRKLGRRQAQEDAEEPRKARGKHVQEEPEESGNLSRQRVQEDMEDPGRQQVQGGVPKAKPAKEPEPWEEIARAGKKLTQETRAIMNKEAPKKTEMPTIPKAPPIPDDDFEVIDLEDL